MKKTIIHHYLPRVITGTVKPGLNKGKSTGARTANLNLALAKDLPPGLYTTVVKVGKERFFGLLYYGYNSISDKDCLEVHILDFSKNIYGKKITATTLYFLRPPKKFKTKKALVAQIKKDLKMAQRLTKG
ncbi:MAG: riboflavin kinase [Candidatus Magasanikbacteria bacterium]|nr:riboflavin kinase [Candidatus Magasanikbacteria bacterium]